VDQTKDVLALAVAHAPAQAGCLLAAVLVGRHRQIQRIRSGSSVLPSNHCNDFLNGWSLSGPAFKIIAVFEVTPHKALCTGIIVVAVVYSHHTNKGDNAFGRVHLHAPQGMSVACAGGLQFGSETNHSLENRKEVFEREYPLFDALQCLDQKFGWRLYLLVGIHLFESSLDVWLANEAHVHVVLVHLC
tara:strand:- start:369 stop:932 length:564 start_codon:yes stop_codon:yes gene_type:complete